MKKASVEPFDRIIDKKTGRITFKREKEIKVSEFKFVRNELVSFDLKDGKTKGEGLIVGVANTYHPPIGASYIIKVEPTGFGSLQPGFIPNETYPYDTFALPEIFIKSREMIKQ